MAEVPNLIGKGKYKVSNGYTKGKAAASDLKEKQRTPSIGFRTDMPFEERHGMRFKTEYGKNKIDTYDKEGEKRNSVIGKTATVYAGYTYTTDRRIHTLPWRYRSGIQYIQKVNALPFK